MINEQIRCKEVRVIGEEGQQLGVMALRDALNMAKDAGVDLVMVSPSANPPVCRIVDYGKFKYEQLRREKEAKKKQKTVEVKEVRLSPNIDVNDLNTKCNSARKFIEKGNKVKVSLRFRGREMAHIDSTKHILEDFAEKLSDIAVIEKAPKMEGYQDFLKGEVRYLSLTMKNPDRAATLFARNEKEAKERYEHLSKLVALYGND